MILLLDKAGNTLVVNPEYLVGAHQEKDQTVITMVGDVVYRAQGTPEDLVDAWAGIAEIEDVQDCSTCDYAVDGESVPGQMICEMCVDYDLWEPADEDQPVDNGDGAGETDEVHVSGVPYCVPLSAIRGGDHD